MVAVGSLILLAAYMLIFAAVQGGRFARNPWLGVTEPYGGHAAADTAPPRTGGILT